MKKLHTKIFSKVPPEYKAEFLRDIYSEDLFTLTIVTFILFITLIVVFLLFNIELFRVYTVIVCMIIFNLIFLPMIRFTYKKTPWLSIMSIRSIQFAYLILMISLSCAVSLLSQDLTASINIYTIAVFSVASLICMHPIESISIYLLVYAAFYVILPHYQMNLQAVTILRINAFLMNLMAWFVGQMLYQMRIKAFIDKKIIEETNKTLKELSIRDAMTTLYHHEYLCSLLRESINGSRRFQHTVSIIMIDIDNFKAVNDTYGHLAGDQIIIGISKILVDTCRTVDIIGRYGGDEFMIIAPDTNLEGAMLLAERIRVNVETADYYKEIRVTVSIGVSEFNSENWEELIKNADDQLYIAKQSGKNKVNVQTL